MKDIKAILNEHCEGLTEEQITAVTKDVIANYKTINEFNDKKERISQLEAQNKELSEQVGNLQGDSEEIVTLREQVKAFEDAENTRKEQEEADKKREAFRAVFNDAVGDREFANDLMRDVLFERVYDKCADDTGIGAKDALESLTKDMTGVWVNPQNAPHNMPNAANVSTNQNDDTAAAAKRSLLKELFQG